MSLRTASWAVLHLLNLHPQNSRPRPVDDGARAALADKASMARDVISAVLAETAPVLYGSDVSQASASSSAFAQPSRHDADTERKKGDSAA
jgi:hypothetical protein